MTLNRLSVGLLVLALLLPASIEFVRSRLSATVPPDRPLILVPPPGTTIDLKGLPVSGDEDAKVFLVEFSDYECPFCARYANDVGDKIRTQFVTTRQVRLAFVNNPLIIHHNARFFATAAICAGEHNQYWQMHDMLFKIQPKSPEGVFTIAQQLGIDIQKFHDCVEKNEMPAHRIEEDLRNAKRLRLSATPSFAIGRRTTNGTVEIGEFIVGAQPLAVFEYAINEQLRLSRTVSSSFDHSVEPSDPDQP